MPNGPTAREMLEMSELINLESMEMQKTKAVLPLIGDDDLRQALSACIQTSQMHLKALVSFCEARQVMS